MKSIEKKLQEAEDKRVGLLAELNEIEHSLSQLTPSDPKRVELKQRKQDVLPRYRGAKQHAKNMRRMLNSIPSSEPENENEGGNDPPIIEDVDGQEMISKVYAALTSINDAIKDRIDDDVNAKTVIAIDKEDEEVIQDFIDWWEHHHDDGVQATS